MPICFPAEWEPHCCCWMAWAVHPEWGNKINKVKRELSEVISTIAVYEPVRVLARQGQALREAQREFSCCPNVTVIEAPVDDIWMRDIAPIFAWRRDEVIAIDFNFNGWGNTKQRPTRPGDRLAAIAGKLFGVPRLSAPFIAEGGALITDGEGTDVTTVSCLLNRNRNSSGLERSRKSIIDRALEEFGIRKLIWLRGDNSELITSGHVDGYAMFTAPGRLLVESIKNDDTPAPRSRMHDIATLEASNDAAGRTLRIERVRPPRKRHWRFHGRYWAPCYLNAYIANGAVIAARFGDPERDELAKDALARAFPGRKIIMLRIDHIASGGGGIRCLTQPMVKAARKTEEKYDRN